MVRQFIKYKQNICCSYNNCIKVYLACEVWIRLEINSTVKSVKSIILILFYGFHLIANNDKNMKYILHIYYYLSPFISIAQL